MKKILFFLSLAVPVLSPAQELLKSDLNLPREADLLVKEQGDYCKPGSGGESQIWDYSRFRTRRDYPVRYFSRDHTGLIGAENGALYTYRISGDSLLLAGYENPRSLVRYQQAGLMLEFPVSYGSSSEGSFYGRGKHGDLLESLTRGRITTLADASGSLILPGGDTLEYVTRVHIHKEESSYYSPISHGFDIDRPLNENIFQDSLQAQKPDLVITDIYQWYEEGYRYPVFETVEVARNLNDSLIYLRKATCLYHPEEQVFLPEDTANRAVLERKRQAREIKKLAGMKNTLAFQAYPNPALDKLEIELSLRQPDRISVALYDLAGSCVYYFEPKEKAACFRETIHMRSLPEGIYLLKVQAGNETVSEKIVKH